MQRDTWSQRACERNKSRSRATTPTSPRLLSCIMSWRITAEPKDLAINQPPTPCSYRTGGRGPSHQQEKKKKEKKNRTHMLRYNRRLCSFKWTLDTFLILFDSGSPPRFFFFILFYYRRKYVNRAMVIGQAPARSFSRPSHRSVAQNVTVQ